MTISPATILLCMDFLSYPMGCSMQSDPVFGANTGDISVLSSGKHQIKREKAHLGAINCIRITNALTGLIHILTGGEDGYLRIWDGQFRLAHQLSMRQEKILGEMSLLRNPLCFGIQSLDFYNCDSRHPRKLLISLRCGEVQEAVLNVRAFDEAEAAARAKLTSGADVTHSSATSASLDSSLLGTQIDGKPSKESLADEGTGSADNSLISSASSNEGDS